MLIPALLTDIFSVVSVSVDLVFFFFFQAEDGIRDLTVTGVQTCALPILDTINENLRNQSRYRQWRVHGRIQGAAPLYNDVAISPFERVVISAAALLDRKSVV